MKKNPSSSIRLYCVRPVREAGEGERKACRAAPEGIRARHAGSSPGGRGDSEPAATPKGGQRRPPRNSRRRPLPGERPGGPRRSSQRRLLPSERVTKLAHGPEHVGSCEVKAGHTGRGHSWALHRGGNRGRRGLSSRARPQFRRASRRQKAGRHRRDGGQESLTSQGARGWDASQEEEGG